MLHGSRTSCERVRSFLADEGADGTPSALLHKSCVEPRADDDRYRAGLPSSTTMAHTGATHPMNAALRKRCIIVGRAEPPKAIRRDSLQFGGRSRCAEDRDDRRHLFQSPPSASSFGVGKGARAPDRQKQGRNERKVACHPRSTPSSAEPVGDCRASHRLHRRMGFAGRLAKSRSASRRPWLRRRFVPGGVARQGDTRLYPRSTATHDTFRFDRHRYKRCNCTSRNITT